MPIQIQQEFPHCERCGIMIHSSQPSYDHVDENGKPVVLCSELCLTEYRELIAERRPLSDAPSEVAASEGESSEGGQ